MQNIFKHIPTNTALNNDYAKWICYRALTLPGLLKEIVECSSGKELVQVLEFDAEYNAVKEDEQNAESDLDCLDVPDFLKKNCNSVTANAFEVFKASVEQKIEKYLQNNLCPNITNGAVDANVELLANALQIGSTCKEVLRFYAHYYTCIHMENLLREIPEPCDDQFRISYLAALIDKPILEVRESLSSHSVLVSTGILNKKGFLKGISSHMSVPEFNMDEDLKVRMVDPCKNVEYLIGFIFDEMEQAQCSFDDFNYLNEATKLKTLLVNTISKRASGINILIHGEPGTGKTEFVKTLCEASGIDLKSVGFKDDDSGSLSGDKRLKNLNLMQKALQNMPSVAIMFDEATDLFPPHQLFFFSETTRVSKKLVNTTLENNPLPTFYIANSLDGFDQAYLSRYSFILEMPPLHHEQRKKLLLKSIPKDVQQHLSNSWLSALIHNDAITARQVKSSTTTLSLSAPPPCEYQNELDKLLTMHMRYSGSAQVKTEQPKNYNARFINCDYDINNLLNNLTRFDNLKLLFSGIPGTGKTQFGHYLVKKIGKLAITISSSDLIDKYIGESEKNIAKMFQSAQAQGKALIIDEVDSLLRSRDELKEHWQVTQVNEFLNQLEQFKGVVICTTNCAGSLDKAVFRRFHLKINFEPLNVSQSLDLFKSIADEYCLTTQTDWQLIRATLMRMHSLTLGDFNAVNSRVGWLGINSTSGYLEELEKEYRIKDELYNSDLNKYIL